MRNLVKITVVLFLALMFISEANAQVENILKVGLPEMYGELQITPEKKYNKKQKQAYRDLYYKLDKTAQDVKAYELKIATEETMQVLDLKELKRLAKDSKNIDSLKIMIKSYQTQINDFLKWDERLAADTLKAAEIWVAYKDNFEAKKYDDAYTKWMYLFKNYPVISGTIYTSGATLVGMKIDKSKTEQEKQAYRDTLFMVYDQQIKVYPDKKGFVLGMKTLKYFDFYIKGQKLDDTAVIKIVTPKIVENYNMAMEAIELSGEQTGYYVFPIAFTLSMYQRDLGNLVDETVIEKYLSYSDILAKQLSAETDAAKKEKIQKGGVDIVDMIFSKSDLSTCVHLCPTMETKYQRNPTDAKNLKSILSILSRKNCLDCQIYTDVAVKLFELEPSSNSAYSLALLFVNKEKYTDAATYFDKAIELEKVDTVKAKFYFEAAKMYAKQSQYSKCREYARGAINLKPNFGAAYVLIADIYANSAGSIGNDQFSKSAVYWVVVDKLLQAKSVDPSIAEEVDKKIGIYSSRYPAKEEGFMQSVLEGSSYSVGGWIGETTTARYLR